MDILLQEYQVGQNNFMLGVSLYKDKVNYLRTEKSNNSLSVTHHGTEKYQNFNQLISNSVKNIIKNEKIRNEDTISFVIDSQFCSFNEIYCEDSPLLEFHNDLSGNSSFKDYFDSYYYPCISRENNHKYYNGRITEFLKK